MENNYQKLLTDLRKVTTVMDSQFKIAGFSFGFDGIIGAFPVLGDAIGGFISLYIVYRAHLAGVPQALTGKMMINILIDVFVGSVPVLGDLFDFFYKVNEKNLRLLEAYVKSTESAAPSV